jgi:GT2 family glycosyltransferase
MTASVVIVSKNRASELRSALASAFAQSMPVEVVVIDDGSTDGTPDMVRRDFPAVRLITHPQSTGYIVGRNEAARIASGDVVFSIDDDAELASPDIVARTLEEFSDPRIGAVAIPQIDTLTNRVVNTAAPTAETWCVAQYIGTAHAVRRDVFAAVGGYREDMVHQGEEGDFCLRMLSAGYVTRLGRAPQILHHESPRRSWWRMDYYGRRNAVRQAWHHVPLPWLPLHLASTIIDALRQVVRTGRPWGQLRGLASGWAAVLAGRVQRRPVSTEVYHLYRRLKKQGPLRISELERHLPPPMTLA